MGEAFSCVTAKFGGRKYRGLAWLLVVIVLSSDPAPEGPGDLVEARPTQSRRQRLVSSGILPAGRGRGTSCHQGGQEDRVGPVQVNTSLYLATH